jgi:hypothetical protein
VQFHVLRALGRPAWKVALVPVTVAVIACQFVLTGPASATGASITEGHRGAHSAPGQGSAASAGILPKAVNEVDCNGWSPKYKSVRPAMRSLCTDPVLRRAGKKAARFIDNGWYVGHDEPSVKFISQAPGSGNSMSYLMKLPVDPARAPTASGSVTKYAELSLAPWFGLPTCDPLSYPQNPCTPDSDTNVGTNTADAAGSAFTEFQFYPPGFAPFTDGASCSKTQWCSALTIDSAVCTFGFAKCNNNCVEPVNFGYLQTNGVPAGPPGPQTATVASFLGNRQTLKLNPGDVLEASLSDPPSGLTATVRDITTGQTGYMTASARNGFMNTSITNCAGHPFTFHAEYDTARKQNMVPWAALQGGVLMEQEIGHFESCNRVLHRDGFSLTGSGQSYHDPKVYQTCGGGPEGRRSRGEGPCNARTDLCRHATTQGTTHPIACPTRNSGTGQLCEFSDGFCFPKGSRPVLIDRKPARETAPVAGCFSNQYQNGDLDFDGTGYQRGTWPNGTAKQPTALQYVGPFDRNGQPYPQVQFETDVAGSEFLCNTSTGLNCTAPPLSAKFYPYWSLTGKRWLGGGPLRNRACLWNLGSSIPGVTAQDFGKDAQYGVPDLSFYGGTLISKVRPNPQFSGKCRPSGSP